MADIITGIKTATGYELQSVLDQDGEVTSDGDSRTCSYTHFNLAIEQLGPTQRYNCWGFTFLPRRYWINSSNDVDRILSDNCIPIAEGSLLPGDIVRYRDSSDVTTHTGRVYKVDDQGRCIKVRSKWGGWSEYVHDPLDVPYEYGTNLAYFRQRASLKGISDLWLKDSVFDTGEQYSTSSYSSPDIYTSTPPYGIHHGKVIFGVKNSVWAFVRNRGDKNIHNVRVRYYWTDHREQFVPRKWMLIPPSPGHPNPTNPFTIRGNSAVNAPNVVWTPTLYMTWYYLLAIAYVNDNPRDSDNPDPIVYPFNINWDNNIAALNVEVFNAFAPNQLAATTILLL